jgi:hypothetical protein
MTYDDWKADSHDVDDAGYQPDDRGQDDEPPCPTCGEIGCFCPDNHDACGHCFTCVMQAKGSSMSDTIPPPSSNLEDLAVKIRELAPPDRLRLAAQLLENRQANLAYSIVDQVKTELGASLALERQYKDRS